MISEIDDRATQDVSILVDDDAETSAPVEERQSIEPSVLINTALADAGDFFHAHALVHQRRVEAQSSPDHRRINLHASSCEFDACHGTKIATNGRLNKARSIMAAIAKMRHKGNT